MASALVLILKQALVPIVIQVLVQAKELALVLVVALALIPRAQVLAQEAEQLLRVLASRSELARQQA